MKQYAPLIAIAGVTALAQRIGTGRRAASDPAVTAGDLRFYRGGTGALPSGVAYFSSSEQMAAFYGSVKEYRLYLRNPKFVSKDEWGDFDSIVLRFDSRPLDQLRREGHDGAVWISKTFTGRMYTVLALSGTQATKKPAPQSKSTHAALEAAENEWDDTSRLKLLRRIAKRLDIDVTGLTTHQGDGYTEVYDKRDRVWVGGTTTAASAKAEYIAGLIRQVLEHRRRVERDE
jgi:hypothetical protein